MFNYLELPPEQELEAMCQIIKIIKPFPKAQRDRITRWALERVNNTSRRERVSGKKNVE